MKANIVVCDDDESTRQILTESLAGLGHTIVQACDGQDALTKVRTSLPDLILMDILMPNMTGIEFVEQFRKELSTRQSDLFIPILLLTALSDVEYRVKGLNAGADDYLTKPFQLRELRARVDALLRAKELHDRLHKKNEELRELQDKLVAQERQLVASQLAGAAAHKIRQPLTGMLLSCFSIEQQCQELYQEQKTPLVQKILADIGLIRRECEAVNKVLDSLSMADAEQTEHYLGNTQILRLEKSSPKNGK